MITLVGMFYGAKKYDLIYIVLRHCIKYALIISISFGLFFYFFSHKIFPIFINDNIEGREISLVSPNSIADISGFEPNDIIVSINGTSINFMKNVFGDILTTKFLNARFGEIIVFNIIRNHPDKKIEIIVDLSSNKEKNLFGITMGSYITFPGGKEVIDIGISYFNIFSFAIPFVTLSMICSRTIQGLGKSYPMFIITCLRVIIISCSLGWYFIAIKNKPIEYAWISILISCISAAIISLIWLIFELRKLKQVS